VLRGELAGVLEEMIGGRIELLALMDAMDNARKDLRAEHGRILQEKEILEEVLEAAKRDVESSRKQLANVESVLLEAEQDKARMMVRLEEVASQPPSPQRSLEAARVVREEMEQELEATRHALQRAEGEVARARADAEERGRAEADRKGEADVARAESMEWQRKHAALGQLLSQQVEEAAAQRAQAQDRLRDQLQEVEREQEATQKAVEEAKASLAKREYVLSLECVLLKKAVEEAEVELAKMRADAEETCKKWEAYQGAERRCSELEASNEKLQGELRRISSQLEDKVREMAGLTQAMAISEQGTLPEMHRETKRAADEARQLENERLREEAEAQRLELQKLNVVRDQNCTLSDNLAALSHELKAERQSNRTKAAETAEAMQALEAQKAALKQQVSVLKDDLLVLRAVEQTRGVQGVRQTNNQIMQTDELPPAHPAWNGALEAAALPDPVQVTMMLGISALFFPLNFQ